MNEICRPFPSFVVIILNRLDFWGLIANFQKIVVMTVVEGKLSVLQSAFDIHWIKIL